MRKKVFVIAEAGVNHNGSMEIAKQLIAVAAMAGVDAVKFQAFKADSLVSVEADKAEYQKQTTNKDESQYEMLKKLELSDDQLKELKEYCVKKSVMFLCSPFDVESIATLDALGIEIYKIPSGEITNYPYLKAIAALNKKVIFSTGMATMQEIKDCFDVLVREGTAAENITILHCNTEYPTPMKDVNLLAMNTIADELGVAVGYSDHTEGIEVAVAAVSLGATVIEKHFTLDKNMEGPDHLASASPQELVQLMSAIRNIEQALGTSEKVPTESELKNKDCARKSIVAKQAIKVGEKFTEDNLTTMRPGTGINPMMWDKIIGETSDRDYAKAECI